MTSVSRRTFHVHPILCRCNISKNGLCNLSKWMVGRSVDFSFCFRNFMSTISCISSHSQRLLSPIVTLDKFKSSSRRRVVVIVNDRTNNGSCSFIRRRPLSIKGLHFVLLHFHDHSPHIYFWQLKFIHELPPTSSNRSRSSFLLANYRLSTAIQAVTEVNERGKGK